MSLLRNDSRPHDKLSICYSGLIVSGIISIEACDYITHHHNHKNFRGT